MAELSKFSSSVQETGDSIIELVQSYQCVRCKGRAFYYLITIRPGDPQKKEFATVSVLLTCRMCKRCCVVHPVVKDGTVLYMSGGDGTGINVSLCNRSSKVIQSTVRSRSLVHKSTPKKNSKNKVVSSSKKPKRGKQKNGLRR